MKYMIKVVPKFKKNPTEEEFQNICNSIVSIVGNYCNNKELSFHATCPSQTDIDGGRFTYCIHIIIEFEKELRSATLFEVLNIADKHPLVMVTVQENRFCKRNAPIYWYHDGETTYYDGGTYISPNYDLYVNGNNYYTIQYVPAVIKNMYEQYKQYYDGVTYMWCCTGSRDNFMEAKTIDEAIEEFEKYYQKQLWKAVEDCHKQLEEATDNFAQFEDYRWRKTL